MKVPSNQFIVVTIKLMLQSISAFALYWIVFKFYLTIRKKKYFESRIELFVFVNVSIALSHFLFTSFVSFSVNF